MRKHGRLRQNLREGYLPFSSLFLLALEGDCISFIYTVKMVHMRQGRTDTYLYVLWVHFTHFTLCLASVFMVFAARVRLTLRNTSFSEQSHGLIVLLGSGTLGKVRWVLTVILVILNLILDHLVWIKIIFWFVLAWLLSVITSCC
jgi:hypothetical protein